MTKKQHYRTYLLHGYHLEEEIIYPEFRSLMARRGWGLARLAEEAHIEKGTLRAILTGFVVENGHKKPYTPKEKTLVKVAENLKISYDTLYRKDAV